MSISASEHFAYSSIDSTKRFMEILFVVTTSAFEFCLSSRGVKFALVRSDHANAVTAGDGTFIARSIITRPNGSGQSIVKSKAVA